VLRKSFVNQPDRHGLNDDSSSQIDQRETSQRSGWGRGGRIFVGGGAKLVKNGRFEIPAGAARKFVSVGAHYGLI